MQHIGTSKIGKLTAKGISYPQLRLPPEYSDIIGHIADVIETEHNGKRAFLIVPSNNTVLKPHTEVLKLNDYSDCKFRLAALEKEISELRSLLLLNKSDSLPEKQKQKAEGEIRTRVVASTGP